MRILLIRKRRQDTILKRRESAQQGRKVVQNQELGDIGVEFRRTRAPIPKLANDRKLTATLIGTSISPHYSCGVETIETRQARVRMGEVAGQGAQIAVSVKNFVQARNFARFDRHALDRCFRLQ